MNKLREAAQAVVERWDMPFTPLVKNIAALRAALVEPEQEPVLYQRRMKADWVGGWSAWDNCSEATFKQTLIVPNLHDWTYEARALYAAPPDTTRLETEYTAATLRINNDLLTIAELTAERDALKAENDKLSDLWSQMKLERDALMAAARLALDALVEHTHRVVVHSLSIGDAIEALKKAGVK